MATVEATKKRRLTQEDCDTVRYLLKYGRTLKEIAEIIHVDPSTVGKIRLADYDLPTYLEQRKAMNRKTAENKRAAIRRMEELEDREQTMKGVKPASRWKTLDELFPSVAEENTAEVPGQMQMDLQPQAEEPASRWKTLDELFPSVAEENTAEVPGQMQMDLQPQAEEPEKKEPDEQTKQMRFQAALIDKLTKVLKEMVVMLDNRLTALDEIRDVLKGGAGDE